MTGRPLVNFTLAINYALGGLQVEGYHWMNFAIHLLTTFTLFGFLRRTLQLPRFSETIRRDSLWIAGSIAALWSLHPLQTETVTYIVERSESLVSLFYLLTLDSFLRSQSSSRSWIWLLISVFFCYCGMGSKEVMVSAPFIILLYDWIFIERKFPDLWRSRRFYYWGLLSSWILLAYLVVESQGRGNVVSLSGKISFWENLQTQAWAICHYLKLIFWPDPLIFDYGVTTVTSIEKVVPSFFVILAIMGAIGKISWRYPQWGFWGIWGVFLMTPSSIIPIQAETIVEHRVYLALAPVLLYVVIFGYRVGGKLVFPLFILVALALGFRTHLRNEDYRSLESIWKSTLLDAPLNSRAHSNYAGSLYSQKKWDEAETHIKEAIRLDPQDPNAYLNYARLYQAQGRLPEAESMCRKAIQINPLLSETKVALATLRLLQGNVDEASSIYRQAIQEKSKNPIPYLNLGSILESRDQWAEAEGVYLEALQNDLYHPEILERLKNIE